MVVEIGIVVAVIMALAEGLKKTGLPAKYIPLFDVAAGIAGGLIYLYPGDPKMGVFYGIVAGLTAAGLFSGVKNTVEKREA